MEDREAKLENMSFACENLALLSFPRRGRCLGISRGESDDAITMRCNYTYMFQYKRLL